MDTRPHRLAVALLVILFVADWAPPHSAQAADFLFESGVAPYAPSASSFAISPLFVQGHRFEVTQGQQLSAAGGFFQMREEGTYIEVFVAVVALDGPTDLPDSYDLHGSDVLATSVLLVEEDGGEIAAPFDLALAPGWYMIALGFGDFGAEAYTGVELAGVAEGWTDGDPTQKLVSFRRDGAFAIEQDGVVRIFATPEPGALAVNVAAFAALAALARRRQRAYGSSDS